MVLRLHRRAVVEKAAAAAAAIVGLAAVAQGRSLDARQPAEGRSALWPAIDMTTAAQESQRCPQAALGRENWTLQLARSCLIGLIGGRSAVGLVSALHNPPTLYQLPSTASCPSDGAIGLDLGKEERCVREYERCCRSVVAVVNMMLSSPLRQESSHASLGRRVSPASANTVVQTTTRRVWNTTNPRPTRLTMPAWRRSTVSNPNQPYVIIVYRHWRHLGPCPTPSSLVLLIC